MNNQTTDRIESTSGRPNWFSYEIGIRAVADLLVLNISFLVGFMVTALIEREKTGSGTALLNEMLQGYSSWAWLGNILALTIFGLSGFYTRGRAYRSRYKALIVAQAVGLSFLCFATLDYLVAGIEIPRIALIVALSLSLVGMVAGRVWSAVWKRLAVSEGDLAAMPAEEVKHVLVVGGAGYVGSALLRKLLDRGYNVRLLDAFMYGDEPIRDLIGHERLEIMRADFRQVDKVVQAMKGAEAVIHIGAIVGDPACALDEEFTIEVNLNATRMIAEVAKAQGIRRFIFASTCSVYGASDDYLDERSALNPVSLYARSKIASEKVLQSMTTEDFRPVILRFGTVYGLSGRTRFDLVVNLLTAKAVVDSKITVFGADQWRPFVHVQDTALAVVKVLEAPLSAVGGEIFNVGSDEQNKTLGDIGKMIRDQVPTAEIISSGNDGDRRNYRVDFSKLKNRLDYKPEWTLEKGIAQVIQAFETGKVTNYQDAAYSNVKFLQEKAGPNVFRTENGWLRSLVDATTESIDEDTRPIVLK